jgi:hypothetical protein
MTSAQRAAVIVDSVAVSLHVGLRWLQAGSAEVIRLRPRLGAPAPAVERQDRALAAALSRWRTRIQRWRGLVLVRRHLLVAVCLAIVLQVANLVAGLSELALLAAPCLLFAGVAFELPRGPGPAQVAGLLDEQIGLYDLIGTGFELETRDRATMRPLEDRALDSAAVAAAGSLVKWRARPAPAGAEWSTLLVGLATLAVLLVLAPVHTAASRSVAAGAIAQTDSARSAHRASAKATASAPVAKAPAPTASPSSHAANGSTRKGFQAPTQTVSKPSARAPAKTGGVGAVTSRTGSTAGGAKSAPGAAGQAGSRTGAGTGVVPVSAPRLVAAAPKGANTLAGSTPAARSQTTSATRSTGRRSGNAGSPTGTSSAGRARGSTRLGGSHTLTGSATKSLPLKAGYAPAPKGSTNASRTGKGRGGGGHGRSQEVDGDTGADGGSASVFVPSDGGAVATAGSGGLISYLAYLQWVQEQPW